jgi:hypothetical protein
MKLRVLPTETVNLTGWTHKINLTYADLAAATGASGTEVNLQLLPDVSVSTTSVVPAGTIVEKAAFNLKTAFDASDSAINSLLITVGDSGVAARFIASTQLAVDGTEILWYASPHNTTTLPYAYADTAAIKAYFTVAGGGNPTMAELNAGELEIYLKVHDLNELEKPS